MDWLLPGIAAAVGLLLLALVVRVLLPSKQEPELEKIEEDCSGSFPRLPGALPHLPEWLLAERDPPYDLREFFAPIPAEENAAPLYLEALAEFHGDAAVCLHPSQRAAARQAAEARVRVFEEVFDSATSTIRPNSNLDAIERALAPFDAGFAKIALAQTRPRCAFELSPEMPITHMPAIRQLALAAQLRVLRDCHHREFDRAIDTVEMMLRTIRDLQYRGHLMAQIFASLFQNKTAAMVSCLAREDGLTVNRLERLIDLLDGHNRAMLLFPLAEGIRMEYVVIRMGLHDIEHRTGSFSLVGLQRVSRIWKRRFRSIGEVLTHSSTIGGYLGKSRPPRRRATQYDAKLRKMTAADFEVEARYCNLFCKEAIAVAELPFEKQGGQQFRLEQLQRSSFLLPALWGVYPRIGIPIARGQAMIGAALCVAAVRRWILGNADKPPDLDTALAAAGIEVPLLDPFSEKPYQLSFHEDQIEIHWEDAEPYVAGTLTT